MQSPDFSQNYFELFGLHPVFDIDLAGLHLAQQALQANFHPDRYVGASDQEKRLSVQMASHINLAYETLRDPVKRSRYLLEINDVSLPDESATTSDAAFLMEQIELREEIEACRENADELDRINAGLKQRSADLSRDFVATLGSSEFENAVEISRKMQFIQRIQQQLSELQFELEDF